MDALPLSPLTALSPLDGRYRHQTAALAPYFSEFGLIRYRARVEVEYFIALCAAGLPQLPALSDEQADQLRAVYHNLGLREAEAVKTYEQTTNHDVKALEYFLKDAFARFDFLHPQHIEFVHFGLTSQDVNNTAVPLALADALADVYLPRIEQVIAKVAELAQALAALPMLARTHGQPASPTTLGKELAVFLERLQNQHALLLQLPMPAKFGGATGNFNAHLAAYPGIDWPLFADRFVSEQLGLRRNRLTTQIDHYDGLAAVFDALRRINVILVDFCRDAWSYISMGYFGQRVVAGEVGSSAMPHKVNPIDFENAEGNLLTANALLDFLSNKLPVSRLQRDLTDSTVLRNLGVPLGHTEVALRSLLKGMGKLEARPDVLAADLAAHPEVLAEAIQTILRREGLDKPYERLRDLTRTGQAFTLEALQGFVQTLEVSPAVRAELLALRPHTYTGTAPQWAGPQPVEWA